MEMSPTHKTPRYTPPHALRGHGEFIYLTRLKKALTTYFSGDGSDAADVHDRHDDDGHDDVEAYEDEDLPQLVDQLHPADAVQAKALCK